MSKLAQAGDNNTTSGFNSIALSTALSKVSSFIILSKPFFFRFSSKRSAASPINKTVLICLAVAAVIVTIGSVIVLSVVKP